MRTVEEEGEEEVEEDRQEVDEKEDEIGQLAGPVAAVVDMMLVADADDGAPRLMIDSHLHKS